MPLYLKIAFRYLLSLKSKTLSFMAIVSILGVALGVSAMIITLSVMNGFMFGIKTKLLQTAPQVMIVKADGKFLEYRDIERSVRKHPEVIDTEPFIYTQGLLSKGSNIMAVYVRGVDPLKDKGFMSVDKKVVAGRYEDILKEDRVIIGKDLAITLGVWVGDKVNLMSPIGKKTPFGFLPKIKEVEIAGIAEFGIYEYDSAFLMVDINTALDFFDMNDSVTGIQLKIKEPFKADHVKSALEKELGFPYIVKSWMDINKSMFQALELEKLAMFLVITLIVVVASFNISSLLITKGREKRKEIGILRAVGADNRFILKIFVSQGLIIGFIGTMLGLTVGLSVIYFGDSYHLIKLNPEVYLIDYLPLKVSVLEVGVVVISSLFICFISSLFPARSASVSIPAEVIRYE
ncbi:MAG: ABC transporter permease [Hydrogenothermaceae bacterium]|nr:ABC transporter permease [Hydrogenothermaceae bacterium]